MKKDKIRVAIIDDEHLVLEGLTLILQTTADIEVQFTSSNGTDFLNYLSSVSPINFPNIALVDIQMSPMDGFELVDILARTYQELKIVIISSHYSKNILGHMIKMGVSAFIDKSSKKDSLVKVIRTVKDQGVFFSPQDHELLIEFMKSPQKKPSIYDNVNLTKREKEILQEICREKTNQDIAETLFLSKRTVEGHRQRILEKVGAKNTVGLVIYAIVNRIHILRNI